MNDLARKRLRAALEALTPPPTEELIIPELQDSTRRKRLTEAIAIAAACLLAVAAVGSMLWMRSLPHASVPATQVTPGLPAQQSLAPHPSPSQPPVPGVVPSPAGGSPAPTPRCHTADLRATLRPLNSAAGQRYAALSLANQSGHPCLVYGYVGMLLLDARSTPLQTNVVRNANPGPVVVSLAPGQSAFTVLHWTVVAGPGESQTAQCEPQPAYLEITPPDETTQLMVDWNMQFVCLHGRIDIGALAPGTGPDF